MCHAGSNLPCSGSVGILMPHNPAVGISIYEGSRPLAIENFFVASITPSRECVSQEGLVWLTVEVDEHRGMTVVFGDDIGTCVSLGQVRTAPEDLDEIMEMWQCAFHHRHRDRQITQSFKLFHSCVGTVSSFEDCKYQDIFLK